VASPALTPALALRHLGELSDELRAAILLDGDGAVAAVEPDEEDLGERLRELTLAVLETAARGGAEPPTEVEVATPAGAVYVVRSERAAIAAVAGRLSLSSLVRYDLRRILADLDGGSP
jgi:hypothetical protein